MLSTDLLGTDPYAQHWPALGAGAGLHAQHADILTLLLCQSWMLSPLLALHAAAPSSHTPGEGDLGSHLALRENETLTDTCTEDTRPC